MTDATERLVNLALYLAHAPAPVSARDVRDEVVGYPREQDEDAFLRMFERDKKELRTAGLVIETLEGDDGRAYRLDRDTTFADEVILSAEQVSTVRAVGAALAHDDSFPFRDDLASALAKISSSPVARAGLPSHISDETPTEQAASARALVSAAVARKRVSFGYVDAAGASGERTVEPYGLFLRDGRWYLVGRDVGAGETRVFAVRRMAGVSADRARPGTPDFDLPDGFDVTAFARLPFQYGDAGVTAVLEFDADSAWRASSLTESRGSLETLPDGSVRWTIDVGNTSRLLTWLVERGPGIRVIGPQALRDELVAGLGRVADSHG